MTISSLGPPQLGSLPLLIVPPGKVHCQPRENLFAIAHHPLDLIEGHGVVAAVVEAGGEGGFMSGHLLGDFELAAVLEVGGNARWRGSCGQFPRAGQAAI